MAKKASFGVTSDEPCGTTFTHGGQPKMAGAHNTKRKAQFGVVREAVGATINVNSPAIGEFPKADKAKLMGVKVIAKTSGQGDYSPKKSGPENFGGSEGVKGTMKSGKMDRKSQRFT
jgi:hypothetical protein